MRKQIDLKVTNSTLTDYRLIGLIVRLIGIMRITRCRNVVCVHPAADRTRTGLSAALWPARGKLCQVVASSEWTAAPGPSVSFVSPHKPRTCTRIACAGEARTDPVRSWHSLRTTNSAVLSPRCSTLRHRLGPRLSLLRGMFWEIGTLAVDSWMVSV